MAASYPTAIKNFSAIVNGVTKLVAALFNTPYDEITAIETALGANMSNVRMGSWASKSVDTSYLAATDGFVTIYTTSGIGSLIIAYTDTSNPPTTIRLYIYDPETTQLAATLPVKKNDYWKITGTNISTIFWIPLGG